MKPEEIEVGKVFHVKSHPRPRYKALKQVKENKNTKENGYLLALTERREEIHITYNNPDIFVYEVSQ